MPEEEKPDLAKKAIQVIVVGGSAASVAFASGAGPGGVLAAGAAASNE
ncbi:MAG: hypothetical protein J2P44_05185 [Candidatus Dormibacteraeota bacterium]|nr:hypothetical protein [Candidatus Dormibacteraeota bacterium]